MYVIYVYMKGCLVFFIGFFDFCNQKHHGLFDLFVFLYNIIDKYITVSFNISINIINKYIDYVYYIKYTMHV